MYYGFDVGGTKIEFGAFDSNYSVRQQNVYLHRVAIMIS